MKIRHLLPVLCLLPGALAPQAFAQLQAPFGRPDIPVSNADRVYAADQTSNPVSVIDPFNNQLLGVIRLGNPVPGALSPLYRGQLLVHGLGFSPDSKTVAVVSVASTSVTLIDTETNTVKGTIYVGRSPHEASFTPDGRADDASAGLRAECGARRQWHSSRPRGSWNIGRVGITHCRTA